MAVVIIRHAADRETPAPGNAPVSNVAVASSAAKVGKILSGANVPRGVKHPFSFYKVTSDLNGPEGEDAHPTLRADVVFFDTVDEVKDYLKGDGKSREKHTQKTNESLAKTFQKSHPTPKIEAGFLFLTVTEGDAIGDFFTFDEVGKWIVNSLFAPPVEADVISEDADASESAEGDSE